MRWREPLNRFVYLCLLISCVSGLHAASTILAATTLGPVKSTDGGATWQVITVKASNGLLSGQPTLGAVAVDPKTPSTWYATGYAGVNGFYKSLDSGQTWTGVPLLNFTPQNGGGDNHISIIIDPVATNTIYMIAFVGSTGFIVKSTDSGSTWSTLRLPNTTYLPATTFPDGPLPQTITADPNVSGVVYAVSSGYVFKSVDFGATWTVLSAGVDSSVTGIFPAVARVDVDPKNSQILYASAGSGGVSSSKSPYCNSPPTGGQCGLYKSVDGGQTWTQLSLQSSGNYSLAFDSNSGAIYSGAALAAVGPAVSKSTDGGVTWTPLKRAGTLGPPLVIVDPANPSTVYAFDHLGNRPGASLRSTDGGATWTNIDIVRLCAIGVTICNSVPNFYDIVVVPPVPAPPPPPAISANGVVNGASFQPGIVANSWVTIQGTNLASQSGDWSNAIVNGKLPTTLNGVSVSMGGKPAYVYYTLPSQINVLAPDLAPGPATVTVTTAAGTSGGVTATVSQYGPAFFLWPSNQVVATRQDFSFAVKAGTFSGTTTLPAKPGDVLILWATGFGPTNPVAPGGVAVPSDKTYATASAPTVTINNQPAIVFGAALAPGAAGLYQIAIQVPNTLTDGDWPIQAGIGGAQSAAGAVLTVHH